MGDFWRKKALALCFCVDTSTAPSVAFILNERYLRLLRIKLPGASASVFKQAALSFLK